jgi:branched-subunit amino acid transport protein
MSDTFIWTVIAGMALANFVLRFMPIAIVSRIDLPAPLLRWFSFIPASVMGALVALEVLRPGGAWTDPISSPYAWATLPTAIVYLRTRSFLGATLTGMASFVALRALLG